MLRRFLQREDGNATFEFVLWLPLIAGIIVGSFDLNRVLFAQSQMWEVARETARRVSVGELASDAADEWALAVLGSDSQTYTVTVTSGTDVTVAISRQVTDVALIGSLTDSSDFQINASVTMRNE